MSAIDDTVLKLTTYMPGGMEWKPDLHPRDHTGKFKKKFGGVFNALSGLKAGKYGSNTVYKGQAGYHAGLDNSLPDVPAGHKVGGVEVHAPTEHGYAPSVHHIDWNLAPGEKVYSVSGGPTFAPEKGATGAILHHANGSASVLLPTPEGEMPKIGATHTHFSELASNLTSIGYTIDTEHPLDSNDDLEAQKVQQEMAAVDHAKEIGAAPESAYGKKPEDGAPAEPVAPAAPKPTYQEGHVGPGGNKIVHMLQDDAGNHVGHVEQLDSGKYTSHNAKGEKVGNITKHLPTAVEKAKSGKLTTPSTYQHKKPLKKAAAEEAKKAEPKAEISPEKKVAEEAPKPEPKKLVKEDVGFNGIPKVGHIQEHEDGSFTAHNHVGEQIGLPHPNKVLAQVAVKKVHIIKTDAEKAAKAKEEAAAAKAKAEEEAKKVAEKAAADKAKAEEEAKKAAEAAKPIKEELKYKAEPQEPAHLEGKKVFQHVHDEQGNHLGHIEKTSEGKYTSHDAAGNKVGNITKHLPTAIEKVKSGKLTTPEKKAKDDVTPVKAEVKDVSATEKHLTGENGQYIGKLVKDETTGKWQSYDASGEKLGYTISNTQTAIDKIKVAAAKNPGLADAKQADDALANATAESDKALKEEPLKVPVTSVDGQIGHLEEGDGNKVKAIYKDGSVLGEFAGVTAAQQAVKKHHIDTVTAEAQKAKLDDLKKSNDEVAAKVEATEVDTPVGKVPLLPGQAAYLSKGGGGKASQGSPWAAVVQDGKVLHIYNPSTGEKKDESTKDSKFGYNYVEGWQKNLDEGGLIKAGEESPEKTPIIPEAEKAVAEASAPNDESGFTHANYGLHGQNTVILQPGEKLWTPFQNPSWGAWVEKANGKADGYSEEGKKVVSDTNLPSGLQNGWKVTDQGPEIAKPEPSAPDAAPVAEIYKNSLTGAEFHFDANGIATLLQPNGDKTTYNAPTSASLKNSMAATLKADNGWSKAELPIPEDHTAPHGATPEPVKKVAAKKAAAKNKLTDADLPQEYEFGGKVHKMKPGDSIWTKEVDGDKKVYAISGISGKGTIYNSDATINYWLGDSNKKVSLATLKKNGWEKAAVGEAKQEISGPEAAVDLSKVPDDYNGGKNAYIYADNVFNDLSGWSSKLNKNDYDAADPEWGKDIAQYAANLTHIKANPDEFVLDKSDKMKVTKALTHANNLWKLHVIATKVDDPNYEPNQQDKTALEEVKAYSDKVNTHYVGSALHQLATKIKAAEFQQGIKNLGFDLNHGSHEEFVNYAKNEGANFLGGMDETMVKDWVNHHIGTPSYYAESGLVTKSAVEDKASQLLKMKAVAANAVSVAEKKAAVEPTKEEKLVEKATTKQYESLYKKVGKLQSAYHHADDAGYEIVYDPSINQFHGYGPGLGALGETTSRYFSPEGLVSFLADHSEWNNKAAGASSLGNHAEQKTKYLKASEGLTNSELINVPSWLPQSLGSQGTEQMTDTQRSDWLTAYLTGDKVAQYQIEKEAVESAGLHTAYLHDHPGNPDNETGQLAVQTLANHLNTLPYWANKNNPYDVTTWSPTELKSFADEFGLTDAFQARDMPEISDKFKVQHWLVWHDQLPEPQNKAVADVSKLNTPEGVSFDVPSGAYVTFNGTNHTVFTDNDFYVVKSNGTETQHFKYMPGDSGAKDKVSAHAFTLAQGNEQDVTPQWPHSATDDFFANMIADFTSAGHVSAQKPSGVSDQVWEFVHGAEAGGKDLADFIGSDIAKATDDEINTKIANSGLWTREERLKMMATSPAITKLAAWSADNTYGDNSAIASEVAQALKAKLNNGDYITPETETWTQPDSGKSFPIPPGATVYDFSSEYGEGTYAVIVHDSLAYRLTPQGAVMSLPTGYIETARKNKEVFTSKANLSYEKAGSEGESFTEHAFKKVEDAEAQEVWKSYENETVAAFKFQQAAKKIDGGEKYAQLTHYLHTFPVGVKQLAMEAALKKDTDTLDALVWKFHKGTYAIAPEVHKTPVVDPTASYAQHMGSGQFSSSTIYDNWSTEDMDAFIEDHNVSGLNTYSDYYDKSHAISQFIPSLIPPTVTTEDKIAKGLADYHNLDLVPTDKSYGGMHTKQGWTDQFGQEWMSKGFNSDPNGNFRVDVEHEANLIGKIFGFNSASTFTKEVGGKYSVIQKIAENIGDLKGFQPKDLNDPQLIGAMQEHILDWLIANHDSHEENLLRLPNGESMLGIDKGQAFKHLGKDKLAVGYLPPENGAPVWYDRFYNALTSGQIGQERADRIAYSVLAKAYAVQSRNDSLYREHLEKAFAQRPADSWPSHLNTKEKFLDYAMERKANLLKDFSEFYQGMYKKAGYDWTIDTEAFGKNVGGAHIANSPVYVSEVKEATAFGKALMFNSPDLEDAHIMHNTMEQMNGGTALLGYGKVRSDADKTLTEWLKNRVEGKLSSGQQSYVPEVAKPEAQLPYVPNLHDAIVNYAKTVGKHATNGGKEPDGAYNADYINSANNVASTLKGHVDAAKKFRAQNPDQLYSAPGVNLSTLEQQDAWLAAAEKKLGEFDLVKQAHEANVPVKTMYPDAIPFEPISYTPSKGLTHHDEVKPAEKYVLDSGEHAVKTSDGGHYLLDKDGGKTWVSAQDYGNHVASGKQVSVEEPSTWANSDGSAVWTKNQEGQWDNGHGQVVDEPKLMAFINASPSGEWTHTGADEQKEESQTVQISGKTFKVTHRKAALHGGVMDIKTGKLIEKSKQSTALQNGYEYTIEHGKVKIHYRPWTESGVLKAQQGVLHYEVRDWDGGHEALDDVLDTLRIAGLDLTPADAESLEHHYWNHLTNVIQDRADRNDNKNKSVIDAVKQARMANPNMTTGESLTSLKDAWTKAYGKDVVDRAVWEPQFAKHFDKENVGRPYWYRPDVGVEGLKAIYGHRLPVHHIQANGDKDAADRTHSVLMGGGLMSTEERPRVLGSAVEGMSSGPDQGHGSSGFVFTRQNMSASSSGSDGGPMMVIDPLAALRTSNYAFTDDNYGEIDNRKESAHFDPKTMYGISNSGNEMMIKHEAPIFAAVFGSEEGAKLEISRLHNAGVFEINGRKVEDVVLSQQAWNNTYQQRIDKLWKDLLEAEKKYTEGGV